jgi:S-adenosylmethionine synthetase
LILTRLRGVAPDDLPVEVVERKGKGHPDSICDALAEEASRALMREYVGHFGIPLHHNVDKALLWAGAAEPAFGGGEVLRPMRIYLAGRATTELEGVRIAADEVAVASARAWLAANLHALDPVRHVEIEPLFRPGSPELQELFRRQLGAGRALANDSSLGVGFAPRSELEQVVLEVEREITGGHTTAAHPEIGEDVKVMGVRSGERIELTVACAFVGGHLPDLPAYVAAKGRVATLARETAGRITKRPVSVVVNAADDVASGSVYLTVTGTSAEAGDDGQAGRGNRTTGLITPYRPMVVESAPGKNPVTHPGKVYGWVAEGVAADLVAQVPGIIEARCLLVSRIGMPIDSPALAEVALRTEPGYVLRELRSEVERVLEERLAGLAGLWRVR